MVRECRQKWFDHACWVNPRRITHTMAKCMPICRSSLGRPIKRLTTDQFNNGHSNRLWALYMQKIRRKTQLIKQVEYIENCFSDTLLPTITKMKIYKQNVQKYSLQILILQITRKVTLMWLYSNTFNSFIQFDFKEQMWGW